ncbi:MAG: hypothetical protein INR73_11720 [Williamsia sp.]|nr:hypothetical protein [Williamsia sp.]
MSWNYIVIAGCLGTLAFVVWNELARPNRSRLVLRLIACLLAVVSLACMTIPLHWIQPAKNLSANTAVLLTEGYQADSVRNFLQQSAQQPTVYSLSPESRESAGLNRVSLPLDSIAFLAANYTNLHVFGNGFDKDELTCLQNRAIRFHPAPLPAGIQTISWTKELQEGESMVVQGHCYNPLSTPVRVVLSGYQTGFDSVMINPGNNQPFQLSAVPKLRGKALFSLSVLNQKDTLEQEPLPVEIDTAAPVKILLLSSAPNFETRFLKDWLAKKGYAVEVRTLISTGKQDRLFANTGNLSPNQLNASLLQQTDVLISDPVALNNLRATEQQAIRTAVAAQGLGLIIRADSLLPRSFYGGFFPLTQNHDSISKQVPLIIADAIPDTASWLAEQPLYIRLQPGSQALVQTASATGVVAGSALYGAGKIVLTTIPNSYSWLLAGNNKTYEAYWSLLIKKSLRKKVAPATWSFLPSIPFVDEPVTLQVETESDRPPVYPVSNTGVAYAQNFLLPFAWQALYWPLEGWQTTGSVADPVHWYVWGKKNWKGVQAKHKQAITRNYVLQQTSSREQVGVAGTSSSLPLPKIYFFIIFLFSAGFLWIEKKLSRA